MKRIFTNQKYNRQNNLIIKLNSRCQISMKSNPNMIITDSIKRMFSLLKKFNTEVSVCNKKFLMSITNTSRISNLSIISLKNSVISHFNHHISPNRKFLSNSRIRITTKMKKIKICSKNRMIIKTKAALINTITFKSRGGKVLRLKFPNSP